MTGTASPSSDPAAIDAGHDSVGAAGTGVGIDGVGLDDPQAAWAAKPTKRIDAFSLRTDCLGRILERFCRATA